MPELIKLKGYFGEELVLGKGSVAIRELPVDQPALERIPDVTVIMQDPEPGATVIRGTSVNLTFVALDKLPLGAIEKMPDAWSKVPVGEAAKVALPLLHVLQYPSSQVIQPPDLRAAFLGQLVSAAAAVNVTVANTTAALDAAMQALRTAYKLSTL
jgi:hypothetical protein